MPESTPEKLTIKLCGDWSMTGVTHQLLPLTEHLATLSRALPQQSGAEVTQTVIDLAEVALFDACGCQLLTVLLRHLKLLGFTPVLANIPDELHGSIALLGFGHEFETILDVARGHA
ncbi:MAG: STAS domain-containing protein [Desulfuromonadales bacterium]|nr:MAG: STAS domain-containing protein [Desulfuromonadales bacterium]